DFASSLLQTLREKLNLVLPGNVPQRADEDAVGQRTGGKRLADRQGRRRIENDMLVSLTQFEQDHAKLLILQKAMRMSRRPAGRKKIQILDGRLSQSIRQLAFSTQHLRQAG